LVVSTEDDEMALIAKKYKSDVIYRPKELAPEDTPSLLVYKHVLEYLKESER